MLWMGCSGSDQPQETQRELSVAEEVALRLEPGHEFYMITSFRGEISRIADSLQPLLKAVISREGNPLVKMLPLNVPSALNTLGLSSMAGVGYSSRALAEHGLFHNRTYVHSIGGRQGLLLISGGAPRKLDLAERLPANTWLLVEGEMDIASAWPHIVSAVREIGGVQAVAGLGFILAQPVVKGTATKQPLWAELLENSRFRIEFGVAADTRAIREMSVITSQEWVYSLPELEFSLYAEGPFNLFQACFEEHMEELKQKMTVSYPDENTVLLMAKRPIPLGIQQEITLQPVIEISFRDNTLKAFSSEAFMKKVQEGFSETLEQTVDFQRANTNFPEYGNSRYYVSHDLVRHLGTSLKRYVEQLQVSETMDDEQRMFVELLIGLVKANYSFRSGIAGFSQNQDEGVLYLANHYGSHRTKLLGALGSEYWNGVLGGAALWLPAMTRIQKVQSRGQDVQVSKQLRQIMLAVAMYQIDHEKEVTLDELVKAGYLKDFEPIDGLFYPEFVFPAEGEWEYRVELYDEGRVFILNQTGLVREMK